MDKEPDIDDKKVNDIDREAAYLAPERIQKVTAYILDNFNRKTYHNEKWFTFNKLMNISDVAAGSDREVSEIRQKQRLSGFNSIFCVSSIPAAKLYYNEFKKQMAE